MADEMITKPTIETVLERIIAFENRFESRFEQFGKQVAERFDHIDNEIDRVASVAHSTKAEMLTLRADFRELRAQFAQLREVLPVPQAS